MAFSRKIHNLKLENELSSGDHVKNEVQTKKINNARTSMESKIAGQGDGISLMNTEINLDLSDDESAYEESLSPDISGEESSSEELHISHISTNELNEIPSCRFTTSRRKESYLTRKFVSTSKICDRTSALTLEDKVKCLSLNEVRSSRNTHVRPTRKNMSFTNDQLFKIERDNEDLLRRIMTQQKPKKNKIEPVQSKVPSSAVNRRKLQRKIEEENMVLLRRLQQAKSCAVTTTKIPGYRRTLS